MARKETQRLLAGRNSANPVEFSSAFNLQAPRQMNVPGVQGVSASSKDVSSAAAQAMDGIAEWGNKKLREAAERRYSRQLVEGAMEQQQGTALKDVDPGDNAWRLEGYRNMDAETAASALLAAQQQEIANGLYELEPEEYRRRYSERLDALLEGKDVATQERIRAMAVQQIPSLVAEHTAKRTSWLEVKSFDSLAQAVANTDPAAGVDNILSFARGEGAASGLSEERRRAAVLQGVVDAYANDNPAAWSVLQQSGALGDLTAVDLGAVRAAQSAYESRARERYDASTFRQEQELLSRIERGEFENPHDAVAAYTEFLAGRGLTMRASEASAIYGGARTAGDAHNQAVRYEIETARINGDFSKVADLSAPYLVEGKTKSIKDSLSSTESGGNYSIVNSEGYTGKYQFGQARLDDYNAAAGTSYDLAEFRKDPALQEKVMDWQVEDILSKYGHAVGRTINGVTLTEGSIVAIGHLGGLEGLRKYLATNGQYNPKDSNNTHLSDYARIHQVGGSGGTKVDITPDRWRNLVAQHGGNFDAALVEAIHGHDYAVDWMKTGFDEAALPKGTRDRIHSFENRLQGAQYQTAQSRFNTAKTAYEETVKRVAVDMYAGMQTELRALDDQFMSSDMPVDDYLRERLSKIAEWGGAADKADVDYAFKQEDARVKAIQGQIDEANKAGDYADAEGFRTTENEARTMRDQALKDITSQPMPEGMDEETFMRMQQEQIGNANTAYTQAVSDAASEFGVPLDVVQPSKINASVMSATVDALANAQKNAQDAALIARAIQDGTVSSLPKSLQDRAWTETKTRLLAEANADVAAQRATPEEAQAELESGLEAFFAKSGFVPESITARNSAALNGSIVGEDGAVNQRAVDAVLAYQSMSGINKGVADQMMDDEARVVADAALFLSGGNPNLVPAVLKDLWAEGLSSRYSTKPDPNFMERPEVIGAIDKATSTGWLRFGEPEFIRSLENSPDQLKEFKSQVSERVELMHRLNPRVNPKHIVDTVVKSMIETSQLVGNRVIVENNAGDIISGMFGSDADAYRGDNRILEEATSKYLMSPEFARSYLGSEVPIDLGAGMRGTFDPDTILGTAKILSDAMGLSGEASYSAVSVINGNVLIDIDLGGDNVLTSIFVPLKEIGDYFKKNDPKFN